MQSNRGDHPLPTPMATTMAVTVAIDPLSNYVRTSSLSETCLTVMITRRKVAVGFLTVSRTLPQQVMSPIRGEEMFGPIPR